MSSLEQLQHDFIHNIVNDKNNQGFLSELKTEKIPPELQLSIYQRNLSGSIQKTLQQVYPACLSILGEDFFHTLCYKYQNLYPSLDSNLNNYGNYFNTMLLGECSENTKLLGFEYLHDLALLEWHWHTCYYSSSVITFDFTSFSKIPENQQSKIIFNLNKSLSIHTSIFPVIDIWKDNTIEIPTTNEYTTPDNSLYFCIYQRALTPTLEIIDRNTYKILTAIKDKTDLQSLCHFDDIDINQALPNLLQKGWISGFSLLDKAC